MRKILLFLSLLLAGVLAVYFMLTPKTSPELDENRGTVALPWNVKHLDNGSTEVFGVQLEITSLQQAIDMWTIPDSMALFTKKGVPQSVEVYFGTASTGPMKASVVLTLDTEKTEMENLLARATSHSGTTSGDAKHTLLQEDQKTLLNNTIKTLTYIPSYQRLDADYFLERLGKPAATYREKETAESWYYPEIGLTLLIDDKGKEVFQYQHPGSFSIPDEANAGANALPNND